MLVSLGSGGGVSDGVSLVGGGPGEVGPGSLLPGGGGGGTSLDAGPGVLGALACGDSLVGGGGGGGVPLEAGGGGGGVSDVVDVVSLGVPEAGPGSLLPGTGLGCGVSLDGPGVLGVLAGEPLVGGGGMLVPLGPGGGVCEISDCVSLGGVNDPSPLLPGTNEPGDGPGLTGVPLDGAGVLGWEVGDGTGDGPGLVGDGDSTEAPDPAEPTDPGEKLGSGGGDPLGGGGTSTELSVVLVSLGASDVGLVDAADGSDVGENDGTVTLDGPSVDDAGGVEPELG